MRFYVITPADGFGICPRCGGQPDMDEEGHYYTCFFCHDTGTVPAEVLARWERDETDEREQFRPVRLGTYIRPFAHEYDYDYADAPVEGPGHRMFSRLISPPVWPAAYVRRVCNNSLTMGDDDLPF